jgi:putative transposase
MKQHLDTYQMKSLCQALSVSRSGYYAWLKRQQHNSPNELSQAIVCCYHQHKARAGAPSIHAQLSDDGFKVCARTIGRYMQRLGLRSNSCKRYKHRVNAKSSAIACPNLLQRQFKTTRTNQVWVGDITYIPTDQGWLYLAVVIDLFSRAVVGWQMSDRMDARLVCDALNAAIVVRGKPTGVMVHTDQGSQYGSYDYRKLLSDAGLVQSMSRRGNCWDNAVAESFFATLKKQAVHGERFVSRQQAKQLIFEYIEFYYNRVRRHSSVQWLSPLQFEWVHSHSL